MPPDENGAVRISMRDVYDEVVGLRADVAEIRAEVKQVGEKVPDHEQRIRGLERWAYTLPPTVLIAAASLIVAVASH